MDAWVASGQRGDEGRRRRRKTGTLSPLKMRADRRRRRRSCESHIGDAGLRGRRRTRGACSTTASRPGGTARITQRTGHIAGAQSVPFTRVVDDNLTLQVAGRARRRCSRRRASSRATPSSATATSASRPRRCCSPRARSAIRCCCTTARSRTGRAARTIRSRIPAKKDAMKPSQPRPYADPYLAGVGLGLVLLAAFVFAGRGLGASGAFATARRSSHASIAGRAGGSAYFARYLERRAARGANGCCSRSAGVIVGGFLSALLAGRLAREIERGPQHRRALAAGARVRRRRGDGTRRRARARLHERPGADRRRAAQRRELDVHGGRVRRARISSRRSRAELAMTAPLPVGLIGDGASLAVAFAIGIAFGWCARARGPGQRAQAGRAVLPDRLHRVQGDVQRDRHGDARRVLAVAPRRARPARASTFPRRSSLPQLVGGLVFGVGFVAGRTLSRHVVRRRGDRTRRRR